MGVTIERIAKSLLGIALIFGKDYSHVSLRFGKNRLFFSKRDCTVSECSI